MALKDFLKNKPFAKNPSSKAGQTDGGRQGKPESPISRVADIAVPVILALFVIGMVTGSVYTLSETESAVVTTLGQAAVNNNKGLQFKIPFIQQVTKINTTVRSFEIGYRESGEGSYSNVEEESTMITSDMNFVDIDFYVTYQVTDPLQYMYATEEPEVILKNLIQSTIRGTVSAYTVDSALTTGKSDIQQNIKNIVMDELEEQNIGLSLIDISIQDVEPPNDLIKEAFSEVENARQNKESALNEANQYRNEQLPAAEAKADNIIQKAEAHKAARINEANGQAARFNSEYGEYVKYPLITKQRMFYEAMEEILPNVKIIINNDETGATQRMYLGDLDGSLGGNEGGGEQTRTGGDAGSSTGTGGER
ncbi:MAG: FtsH protease activity modulator HflK [Lachnospiraceae bacterium]|nr:FtsH protease activity modulator HflK [Lachnospiraceae bacterium]